MKNYEYIVASLPDITTGWKFGDKGPQDYIEEIVSLCSDKDRDLIEFLMSGYMDENLNADFYAKALTHKDRFISEYFRFDLNVRNAKVKYLNKALGRPSGKDVLSFPEDADQKVLDAASEEFEESADEFGVHFLPRASGRHFTAVTAAGRHFRGFTHRPHLP
jgi:hypothetical protein